MKRLLALLLAITLVLGLAACGGNGDTDPTPTPDLTPTPAPIEEDPVLRIGALFTLSGYDSPIGRDQQDAATLFFETREDQMGPYTVEFFVEDDGGVIDTALAGARSLVETEEVHLLFGAHRHNVGFAIAEYAIGEGIPYLIPSVTAEDLTQRRRNDLLVRTGESSAQATHPFGQWAFARGYNRIATVAVDEAASWETVAGFRRTFEEAGGEVIIQLWTPAGTSEFRPFLGQLPADIDAIFINYATGTEAMRMIEAIAETLPGITIFAGARTVDETVLPRLNDAALGIYSASPWIATSDHMWASHFTDRFVERFGRIPSSYAMETYTALTMLDAAIGLAGGFSGRYDRVLEMLRNDTITPKGIITLDGWNNPTQDIHIRQVARVDGILANIHVHTFPQVTQFWTYDPFFFLALPVYDRNFNTADHNAMLEELGPGDFARPLPGDINDNEEENESENEGETAS